MGGKAPTSQREPKRRKAEPVLPSPEIFQPFPSPSPSARWCFRGVISEKGTVKQERSASEVSGLRRREAIQRKAHGIHIFSLQLFIK